MFRPISSDLSPQEIPPFEEGEEIEQFRMRENLCIEPPSGENPWEGILSSIFNIWGIRDIAFFVWKTSFRLLTSSAGRDFATHLHANPIPSYFSQEIKEQCEEEVKQQFFRVLEGYSREEPAINIFEELSTLRMPPDLYADPTHQLECKREMKRTIKTLLDKCTDTPPQLWIGFRNSIPSYALNHNRELTKISPHFISALTSLAEEGEPLPYLHLHGRLGDVEKFENLFEHIDSTYIQLSPNNGKKIPYLLTLALEKVSTLKQLIIEPESPRGFYADESFWQILTHLTLHHPHLESIVCRGLPPIPEEYLHQIEQSGKHISWS